MIEVIVPTYNEEKSITNFLKVLKKELKTNFRVIIIDDSIDKTSKVAKKVCEDNNIHHKIIKRTKEKGKGSAVNLGLKELKGDIGVIIDADLEYHPKYILPMIKMLKEYDLVTSVRIRKDPWYRQLLGKIFKYYVMLLFRIPFETQSGLKVFKTKSVKDINIISKKWVFDVELIYKLMRKTQSVGTYEIEYTTRQEGESKINIFTPLQMFNDLWKLRLKL